MQARMKNPAMIIPGAMEALQNLAKASEQGGVPKKTLDLVHLRASQINGCSLCVDMGFRDESALASLVLWIATTNVWNRLNVATKQVAGEWAKSDEAREWRKKQVAAG